MTADPCGAGFTLDPTVACTLPTGHDGTHHTPGSCWWGDRFVPTEPAPDRMAEAREAVARWLCADAGGSPWGRASDRLRDLFREDAAALFALPELRALIGADQP